MKAKERPKIVDGKTHKITTGCGSIYVTVNEADGKVFEVFAKLGKAGGCSACTTEALTRSMSIGLRAGVELEEYYKTLKGISCNAHGLDEGTEICSCPDAIAQVIFLYLPEDK